MGLCSPVLLLDVAAQKPNILFILSDDHTAQSWGVYDGILSSLIKNENIRRLANEGVVLDNTFCTNSISVPSRASILTGAYGHVSGVRTLEDGLKPDVDNIAKQMQEGGYQTALFGKWHLRHKPSGFDYFEVFPGQGEYQNPVFKKAEGWVDDYTPGGWAGERVEGFSTDIVTAKTIDWLENRDQEKPFMMFCHFKATHEPWDFPERLKDLYNDVDFPEPHNLMIFDDDLKGRTFIGQQLENIGYYWTEASKGPGSWWCEYPELPFSIEGLDRYAARRKIYQKFIKDFLRCGAAIDDNIGKLLKYLDDNNLAENTIVVYVSDQGYFLGEHGMFDKRIMYEEPLRMPMVVRYPKEIPAGTRNNDIILNIDFAATLADYAGVKTPTLSQGVSFRENLKGNTPKRWRQSMYYRYWTHEHTRPANLGIRNHRYKLIYFYGDPLDATGSEKEPMPPTWEFYDLKNDPSEDINHYATPKYRRVVRKLKKEINKLALEFGDALYPQY